MPRCRAATLHEPEPQRRKRERHADRPRMLEEVRREAGVEYSVADLQEAETAIEHLRATHRREKKGDRPGEEERDRCDPTAPFSGQLLTDAPRQAASVEQAGER